MEEFKPTFAFPHKMPVQDEDFDSDYDRPFRAYYEYSDFSKKYSKLFHLMYVGNLAAIDGIATLFGTSNTYQKTYQDRLKVNQLVDDDILDCNPHLDKLFQSGEQFSPRNMKST